MFNTPVLLRALEFAATHHAAQVRKFNPEPYILHPIRVAKMVAENAADETTIVAAILHDIVEDTPVTIKDIYDEFGMEVALVVADLTNLKDPSKNRAIRKAEEVERARGMTKEAKVIRLADIIDNVPSIVANDKPEFAKLYVEEKRALVKNLIGTNTPALYAEVLKILYK